MILSPVSIDNPLLLALRKLSDPKHALGVAWILCRTEHVAIVALGALDLIAQTRDIAYCEFERGETNTVRLTLPSLLSILVEHGKHLHGTVRRKVSSHNALDIRACHGWGGCMVIVIHSAGRLTDRASAVATS